MKNIFIFLLFIFPASSLLGQNYKPAYGTPRIFLIETDPWLMVMGSDIPTFALYENGQVLYKKVVNKKTQYFETKIEKDQIQALVTSLGISDSLQKLPANILASNSTDQATNVLILNFDSVKQVAVYGSLRNEKSADRLKTPASFLRAYDNIIHYENAKANVWLPDTIEVMLTNYSYSPEKPLQWPKQWPDLKNKNTVKRSDDLYSIYLDKKDLDTLIDLLRSLKEKQAIEIDGQKFSASYRLPFPNIR